MPVVEYELDLDLENFDLATLADTLKSFSHQLDRRVLCRIGEDGQLRVLGEVVVDRDADAVIVTPTEEGVCHWGLQLDSAVAGRDVVLDGLTRSLAALTGTTVSAQEPFAALDSAMPEAGLWAATTEAALYVRRHDNADIGPDQIVTVDRIPSRLKRGSPSGVHAQAVASAWRSDPARPDWLVPVITKAVPIDASATQRLEEGRALVLEYAALTALSRQGLPTVKASLLLDAANDPMLVVERFDRKPVQVEAWSDGRASVRASDLAAGPEVIDIQQYRNRFGQVAGRDHFDAIQTLVDPDAGQRQQWMTRRLFDVLIGNTDHHAGNAVVLRGDAGKVMPAPHFDVTPYLMTMPQGAAREAGLAHQVLGELTLEGICDIDVSIKLWAQDHPEEARGAFKDALQARKEMARILREELVPQGFASRADVLAFEAYLSTALNGPAPLEAHASLGLA